MEFVTKFVFYEMSETDMIYLSRFFCNFEKIVGVPGDPGAQKLHFSLFEKNQNSHRMILTIVNC